MEENKHENIKNVSVGFAMPIVEVQQGKLRGVVCQADEDFYAFKGIPYAKPPVGALRFKAPEPPEPWEGVLDASEHRAVCPQYNERLNKIETGSEDCLYLNVYSKHLKPDKLQPVLVWIHGGGFYTGSGDSSVFGPEFFMEHDVILVTFNYRLEALGFLCLDNEEVPGNAGMKDQVAALKWVKTNITNFGGDPENITIFGCSAGGASVALHMISEMSAGLFNKAICQSGVCLHDWSYNLYPLQTAFQLGKTLGKETENVDELLEFLRSVPVEKLVNIKLPEIKIEHPDPLSFAPVVEKDDLKVEKFMSESPPKLAKKGNIAKVPLMLGYTSGDGIEVSRGFVKAVPFIKIGTINPREIKLNVPYETLKEIDKKVRLKYFGDLEINKNMIQEFTNLMTDIYFSYNTRRFARYHFKHSASPIYYYKFSAETERNVMKKKYNMEHVSGVCHSDDQFYLFNPKCVDVPLTTESIPIIKQVVKLWTNFATYGNPTKDFKNVEWKPFTEHEKNCLIIDKDFKCVKNLDEDKMTFWDEIYGENTEDESYTIDQKRRKMS